jgi:DNA methylase
MDLQRLVDGINYRGIVSGLTHDFYRYPARFSPMFARVAIEAFTEPGDTILDPFVGGATSLVEALALGRNAVGVDISQLAVFLARVKTSVLPPKDIDVILDWATQVTPDLSTQKPAERHLEWQEAGYQQNLPWRFRKLAEQALNRADKLPERLKIVARCIVLKTVQWAVDCKKHLPTANDFRNHMLEDAESVTNGLRELNDRVSSLKRIPAIIETFHASSDAVSALPSPLLHESPPKLVITSPPYLGIHVLYHRWQVQGRRETPAPFWIANCLDGQGASFYTFGDRKNARREKLYFGKLLKVFMDIREVVSKDAFIVQLVGFAEPDEHLPQYLQTMSEAGFKQHGRNGYRPNQFWRSVPNRKWYTSLRNAMGQTSEVLLIHRPG